MAFSLVTKVVLGVAGVGAVGSAVAVPTVLTLNAPPRPIVLDKFPSGRDEKYKGSCQVMIQDKTDKKYLLVCVSEEEDNSANFYYYQYGQSLVDVKSIKESTGKEDEIELELTKDSEVNSTSTASLKASPADWKDLIGKWLGNDCEFSGKRDAGYPWKIKCSKNDSKAREIFLTPLVIKE